MKNFYVYAQVFLLLFFFQISFAQQKDCLAVLQGYLHNAQHEPLIGATVYIPELKKGVITDAQGRYVFEKICLGKYTLEFKFVGYQYAKIQVDVISNLTEKNLELEDQAFHLKELAVNADKISNLNQTQTLQAIEREALDKLRGKNLAEALQQISGVFSLQTGPTIAKPVIQGLHSNRILILNNGIRQEGQQWGSEHAPEIDPFIASKLTVIKGANAIRYGADAIGGVILVEPDVLPKEKSFNGKVNLVGIANGRGGVVSSTLEGSFGKGWGWRTQGTWKRLGDVQTPDYNLSNTASKEINFSTALGYQSNQWGWETFFSRFDTEIGIFRGAHIGNLDDLERAIESARPLDLYTKDFSYEVGNPRQKIAHNLLKMKSYWRIPSFGVLNLQYGWQFNSRREFDNRLGDDNRPSLNLELSTHLLDITLEHLPWKQWEGSWGINTSLQDNFNIPDTGIRPLVPQYRGLSAGLFWIEKYIQDRWEVELGVRYDYKFLDILRFDRQNNLENPQFSVHNFSWSVGGLYKVNSNITLKSNLASAWRPPQAVELYSEGLHHGTATIEEGLALNREYDFRSEKSIKWVNTFSFQDNKSPETGFNAEISAFINPIQNYIFLEPQETRLTIRGAFPVFHYQQTNALFWGIDGMWKTYLLPQLVYQGKFSWVRARDMTRESFLIFIPSDRYEHTLSYEIGKFKNWSKMYVSLSLVQVMRQRRAPEVFTIAQVKEVQQNDELSLPDNSFDFVPAPNGYFLANAGLGGEVTLGKQKLGIHATVENLFNVTYREYMNRFRYFTDEIGRNCTIRLKYSF